MNTAYAQDMAGTRKADDPRRDVIANDLREAIISGRFKVGERLIEDALAEQYGVSRVPVREALRRLETEGFVTLTPYRGATVSTGSARDSLELMQVRRGLEVMAARLSAENRGGEVAAELSAVVDRGREAAHSYQVQALPPLIMEFHELVAVASGNHQLQLAIDGCCKESPGDSSSIWSSESTRPGRTTPRSRPPSSTIRRFRLAT
jgi:DNA-binding GntR family transcriptional regulator